LDIFLQKCQISESGESKTLIVLNTTSAKKIMHNMQSMKSVAGVLANSEDDHLSPSPFTDWETPRIYQFVKAHLRSPGDDIDRDKGWTQYMFAIIDGKEGVEKEQNVVSCSDAREVDGEICGKAAHVGINKLEDLVWTLETLTGLVGGHVAGCKEVFTSTC
jgi:hypothetical protein